MLSAAAIESFSRVVAVINGLRKLYTKTGTRLFRNPPLKLDMAGTQPDRPMILGNCISCNGLMRVPVTTDVTHVARCPHCGVRFPVQQLIASAIPAAEIMDGEVAENVLPIVDRIKAKADEVVDKPRRKFDVAKQLHDGAKHRRRRRRRSRSSEQRDGSSGESRGRSRPFDTSGSSNDRTNSTRSRIDATSVPVAATQPLAAAESAEVEIVDADRLPSGDSSSDNSSSDNSAAMDSVPNPRSLDRPVSRSSSNSSSRSSSRSADQGSVRRQTSSRRHGASPVEDDIPENSFLEIVKIALGGLIAFPLAYLGLMWIAGLDPFSLAGPIQNVAPVFVPPSLMEEDQDDISPAIDGDGFDGDGFDEEPFDSDALPMPSIDPDEIRG